MSIAESFGDPVDIDPETYNRIDRWAAALDDTALIDKPTIYAAAAFDLYGRALRETSTAAYQSIANSIEELGASHAELPPETVFKIMLETEARAKLEGALPSDFETARGAEPPEINSQDDSARTALAVTKPAAAAVLVTPAQWPAEAPSPIDWLVSQRIPRGEVTTLHGDGGAGKTDIALRLAANVARGAPDWLGMEIAQGQVVFISAEEPQREIHRRVWLHGERDGYTPDQLTNLSIWFPEERAPDTTLAIPNGHGVMQPTPLFDSIGMAINQVQPVLVLVDNVAATFAGNQNDRVMVRTYVNLWRAVARIASRPAVVLIDHPSMNGLNGSGPMVGRGGNMDWRNAVRSALYLYAPTDKAEADRGIRVLETMKSNYGPSGPTTGLRLQWSDGGLEREAAPTSLTKLAKEAECDEIFLRLLDERNAQGRHVGSKTSAMYAPKEFAASPNNGGFTKPAFAAAMARLFAAGVIQERWDSKRRHDHLDRATHPEAPERGQ